LLFVARTLEPASRGYGTHQQLGLPPCTMQMLAGLPCPGCGMTTSWSYVTRGEVIASMKSNLGGFLLAIYSTAFAGVSLRMAVRGELPSLDIQRWLTITLLIIVGITFIDWLQRLLT
jgi:hypothetical protein